jgi:MoxR-like ATPase
MEQISKVVPGEKTRWDLIDLALEHVNTIMLIGPPSVGKTYAALYMGLENRECKNVYSCTMFPDTPASELRGHFIPKGGGSFEWHDGAFVRAMREGARLIINEISKAGPDVEALLHPTLEDIETSRLTLPTGETVCAKEGFQVVVTDNQEYTFLSEPLQTRLLPFFVGELHPSAFDHIPEKYHEAVRRTIYNPSQPKEQIALRHWKKFFNLEEKVGVETACEMLFKESGPNIMEALAVAAT